MINPVPESQHEADVALAEISVTPLSSTPQVGVYRNEQRAWGMKYVIFHYHSQYIPCSWCWFVD